MNNHRQSGRMHDGVIRILSVLVGIAGLGYAAINMSLAGAASPGTVIAIDGPSWLGIVVVVVFFVLPVALACLTLGLSPAALQRVAGALAATQVCVVAAFVLPVGADAIPPRIGEVWLLVIAVTPVALAGIAFGEGVVAALVMVLFLLASSLQVRSMNSAEFASGALPPVILNTLLIVLASSVVAAFILVSRRLASAFDAAAAAQAGEFVQGARDQARFREKIRFDALMHDQILATLIVAHRDRVSARAEVALGARQTLEQLDLLATSGPGTRLKLTDMSGSEFVTQQREVILDSHSSVVFTFEIDSDGRIPSECAQAMAAATTEALRNSIRHAGVAFKSVERAVHTRIASDVVEVFILDNGAGFDTDAVPHARMGVAVSIIERMRGIDGGDADVRSGVGVGTIVTLRWRRP